MKQIVEFVENWQPITDDEKQFNEQWQDMLKLGVATEQEMHLVTDINGSTVETLDDILYVRIGYRNWKQFEEAIERY